MKSYCKEDFIATINADAHNNDDKRRRLKNLDCFVLDNSLRESTVGQVRGHTLSDKFEIHDEVTRCGFRNFIVAAFSDNPRVDDSFLQMLAAKDKITEGMYAFSEVAIDKRNVPVGLAKMKTYGIRNPVLEVDLANPSLFEGDQAISMSLFCEYLEHWITWSQDNLPSAGGEQNLFVNIRDFPFAISAFPERVFDLINALSSLPGNLKPSGIMYEEPTGACFSFEMASWTAATRACMDRCGWTAGHLLAHVHEKWGMAQQVQLECLASGANGIWAGLSNEGAAFDHAGSAITLMMLWRLGNKKILQRYNCEALRSAAMNVARITTGVNPAPKHPLYGSRALDFVFDFGGIAGGNDADTFALADFFGIEAPVRISTLASNAMIVKRLQHVFGQNDQFNLDMAAKMHNLMIVDLTENKKENYMKARALADLFSRAGGSVTNEMLKNGARLDYTYTILMFALLGLVGFLFAFLLKREDKKNFNSILEQPEIA